MRGGLRFGKPVMLDVINLNEHAAPCETVSKEMRVLPEPLYTTVHHCSPQSVRQPIPVITNNKFKKELAS